MDRISGVGLFPIGSLNRDMRKIKCLVLGHDWRFVMDTWGFKGRICMRCHREEAEA